MPFDTIDEEVELLFPAEARWDVVPFDEFGTYYDYAKVPPATRLCFDCTTNQVDDDGVRCTPCSFKHRRRARCRSNTR